MEACSAACSHSRAQTLRYLSPLHLPFPLNTMPEPHVTSLSNAEAEQREINAQILEEATEFQVHADTSNYLELTSIESVPATVARDVA